MAVDMTQYLVFFSVIVLGDYLYIDGGMPKWFSPGQAISNENTFAVPLTQTWDVDSIPYHSIMKPSALRQNATLNPALWIQNDTSFFSWSSWDMGTSSNGGKLLQEEVWQFIANDEGGGTWKPTGDKSPQDDMKYWMDVAQLGDTAYFMDNQNDQTTQLIVYDWRNSAWTYQQLDEGIDPTGASMVALPDYASEGLLVFLGAEESFSDITIFDPSNQAWYRQTTTGDVPSHRKKFGIAETRSVEGTFEIFIHSGLGHRRGVFYDGKALSDAYVLSIPSFTWFEVSGPFHNYWPGYQSQCTHIGGGQILALDAIDWDVPDGVPVMNGPLTGNFSVVDLSTLSRKTTFDPNAGEYTVAPLIAQHYQSTTPEDIAWDSTEVKQLFLGDNAMQSRFWSINSTNPTDNDNDGNGNGNENDESPDGSSGLSGSAIAGIVIGVLVAVIALLVLCLFLLRRHRRKQKRTLEISQNDQANQIGQSARAGESNGRFEKPELPATEVQRELDAEPVAMSTRGPDVGPTLQTHNQQRVVSMGVDAISPLEPVEVHGVSATKHELDQVTPVSSRTSVSPVQHSQSNDYLYEE